MGMLKKVVIVLVLVASVIFAGIVILPGGLGKVGFNGGTAYITTTVVGTNGERIVLEKQAALTQSIVYEGIEVASFEYAIEIEFDGSVDVEIGGSKIAARLNCDVSCIMMEEWGIPTQTLEPGRHELAKVSLSASDIETVAPGGTFELKFIVSLQWRPATASEFKFLDITYPVMTLQSSAPDVVIPPTPPDDPDDPYDPPDDPPDDPYVPPGGGGGYYILAIDPVPKVEER